MKNGFIKIVSIPKVVIGNLQKLFVVKKQTVKNSGRFPSPAGGHILGDDNFIYQKGFTLIELLVVVLIIGILAAVAVPQYQKAVTRARFVKFMAVAESIYKAELLYKTANGNFTQDLYALDIQLPAGSSIWTQNDAGEVCSVWLPKGGYINMFTHCEEGEIPTVVAASMQDYGYFLWYGRELDGGRRYCQGGNEKSWEFCRSVTGSGEPYKTGSGGTYQYFEYIY